ncbi:MAG: hypothetical protein RL307_103 [Pseudomonadota bacterium]
MWFTRVSLKNPVFATMVMLAFVVLGLFAYQRLKVDQFPNIDVPVVVIVTDYPGASPEIVESEVSKKIEEAVNSVAGISSLSSTNVLGRSTVAIEFQLEINGRKAADDVREKVASVRPSLRAEVKEPRVIRFDPSSRAIWSLAVLPKADSATKWSDVDLTTWADQVLRKRLENIPGVGQVSVVGGTNREINLYLDPNALNAYGISPDQVVRAVKADGMDAPLGILRDARQERVVQMQSAIKRPEDFGQIIVGNANRSSVRLSQLAQVHDGASEIDSLALYNGQRTLTLNVQKAQDENTLDVIDKLNKAVDLAKADLPAGIELVPLFDISRPIRVSVKNVKSTLYEGAILTVLIVFLFLNSWRSTVITGLTLPISLIGTFMFMQWLGFTINMVTLMALSLCVGLLIDDAIVVRENIVRHVQMGKSAFNAAMDGTQEIGLAVLATTLSIVAVFLPIGFMQGIIGKFFHEFGITIVAAVLISMFVSFTLDPMLSSVWHDPSIHSHGKAFKPQSVYDRTIGRVTHAFEQFTDWLGDIYQHLLGWSLHHRLTTVLIAVGVFVLSIVMVPLLGTEFVPKADFSETYVKFSTPVGSSLEQTEAKAKQVESVLREIPELRDSLTTINTAGSLGKNKASIYVRLIDRKNRTRNVDQVSADIRMRLQRIAGITVTHVGLLDPVGGQKQLEMFLTGPDQNELNRLAHTMMTQLAQIPGLVDLDSSVQDDSPRLQVQLKRTAAADLGLSSGNVSGWLRTLIAGEDVGTWRDSRDQTYDVKVRLAPEARQQVASLAQLPLPLAKSANNPNPSVVRLGEVAELTNSTGAEQINRRDLTRQVAINGNAYLRSTGEISADIRKVVQGLNLPPGYGFQFSGSTKNMEESFRYALQALALAVIFIYMILASQFKSFLQPLALMTSLPLTLIGVVLALMMFGSALSLFSVIGVVMLMGLVTKNAILLVDFAIRSRESVQHEDGSMGPGLPRHEALLLAAKVRLRPILMTTLAMVFGMVPLALALSEGSEQRSPMGQAVIGGVITSSLLTLVVVPVVYCYLDDLSVWLGRVLGMKTATASPQVEASTSGQADRIHK